MQARDGKGLIQSLGRGLEILMQLADHELGVTEVAQLLGVDKASAYRLLGTLESRGFVAQNDRNRKYHLGLGSLTLAGSVLRDLSVREVARPYLERLSTGTGETTFLGVLNGGSVVYVEKIRSHSPLTVTSEVGMRAHLHCTATGKAVLAFLPAHAARDALRQYRMVELTPRTITNPEILLAHLEEVRARGYAVDDEEYCIGLRCVAGPVFDYSGQVFGSISISGPAQRVSLDRTAELGALVVQTAQELSRTLGYTRAQTP